MAADAGIFAQFMRPVKSVADYGADMDARETNKLALVAARMKAQQDQQTMTDEQTFRGLAQQHGGDQNALMRAAMGAGLYGKATGIQKTLDEQAKAKADLGKTGADTRKTEAEIIDKSLATAKTFVNQIQDAQGAAAYLEGVYADPVLGPLAQRMMPKEQAIAQIPQDPQQLLRWKAGHMQITGDKLIDLLKPKTDITNMGGAQSFGSTDQFSGQRTQTGSAPITETANNIANNARIASEGALNRGVQVRGQDLLDQRAQERLKFDKEDSVRKLDEKPLNDTQSKALLFGSRMREADKVLESLAKSGTKASVPGSRAGYGVGSVVTALSSSQQQQLDQAKRDFLSAVLRRESGAVISDSEFDNGDKQYFPQIGDSPQVIKQKAANRKLATDGILQEVPERRRDGLQPTPQMPTADDVRKQADNILKGG